MFFGNLMYSQDVYSHSRIRLIFVAMKVSCHCGSVSVFDVKNVTLECMILFLVCPKYFIWHQLHSSQYMRLLLWHIPFLSVL